jgi:hypothetical protein
MGSYISLDRKETKDQDSELMSDSREQIAWGILQDAVICFLVLSLSGEKCR